MFIIPRKDFKIRDPIQNDFLPEAGREVTDDLYWAALVRDGDVTVPEPKVDDAAKPSKTK